MRDGILALDDSTLDKPFSKRNDLVYRRWSGKHKEVVSGINLISLLWTDGDRAAPCDYRIFDKDTDRKTKNDHFSEMVLEAHKRGFAPQMFCFDSWYASIENLKLVRGLGWHFLTRLKANRQVNPEKTGLQAVSEIEIPDAGRVVWLKGYGLVKVFRIAATNGSVEHWASSQIEITELERVKYAGYSWQIEHFHRGIKQQCLIERAQCRRRQWQNTSVCVCGRFCGWKVIVITKESVGLKRKPRLFEMQCGLTLPIRVILLFQLRNF